MDPPYGLRCCDDDRKILVGSTPLDEPTAPTILWGSPHEDETWAKLDSFFCNGGTIHMGGSLRVDAPWSMLATAASTTSFLAFRSFASAAVS
jgi:hypothetical protein